jgi:pimeloyl-ACP methyl ester carboxylesterase
MPGDAAVVSATTFRSLDGLRLCGTLVVPPEPGDAATVLVHGGGVNRDEGGFFTRLAFGLADAGISSLPFDLRGHGESSGRQEDLTLAGVANDIRAAISQVREMTGSAAVNLIGTSFAGGISVFCASRHPDQVRRLVLFNPLLNYKKRFIDDKPYWHDDCIGAEAGAELSEQGFVAHSPTFRLGRALLNEVFYIQPHRELGKVIMPTLIVHGTRDTFIPVESSRAAVAEIAGEAKLIEIDGAQHGFAVHDDPQYLDPQTQEWQAFVIQAATEWLASAG